MARVRAATPTAAVVAMSYLLVGCGAIGAVNLPVFNRTQSQQQIEPAALPPVETAALPPPGQQGQLPQQGQFPQQGQVPQQGQFPQQPGQGGFVQSAPPPQGGFNQPTNPPVANQQQLEPLPGVSQQPQQQVATLQQPSANSGGLGRTDLLGGWTITAGGDSCQLFMTLTSWQGGYRASTRGCSNDTLKTISAWDLKGTQVVLSKQGGTPVARLFSSGGNRFDGQTEGQAAPVSFYR